MTSEYEALVARLRAMPRRERVKVGQMGGVPLQTLQNLAMGYRRNPTINTVDRVKAALAVYDAAGGAYR